MLGRHRPLLLALVFTAAAFLFWQYVIAPAFEAIPSPSEIATVLEEDWDTLWADTRATAEVALLGLLVGSGVAIGLALLSLVARSLESAILRLGLALYSVPIIVVAPLLVLWLGQGQKPRVAISALAVFFIVLVNTIRGFRATTRESHELLHVFAVSRFGVLRYLRVPSALPYLMSALKVAVPASVFGAVIGEWIGANRGLGVVMFFSLYQFDVPKLWAAMVLTTGIALAGYVVVALAERFVMPWHESVHTSRLETA
jgi:ABC-type nitrate/sulfonate/bicarbonate transport system permease component